MRKTIFFKILTEDLLILGTTNSVFRTFFVFQNIQNQYFIKLTLPKKQLFLLIFYQVGLK